MRRIPWTLALAPLLTLAACGYGDFCWQDRCEAHYANPCDQGNCGTDRWSDGCLLSPDGGIANCGCDPGNSNGGCTGPGPDYPSCWADAECFPEERCVDGWCQWSDPGWCERSEECPEGQVCTAHNECQPVVTGCPLTDACLADPEGYTPEWMGIDPYYVGVASGNGFTARVDLLVDFYADHFYGDAIAMVRMPGGWEEWVDLIVTGDRMDAQLEGQVVERNAQPRRFDATFTAVLQTASRLVGTVTVAVDGATFEVPFDLWRVSPCGCEITGCAQDADCPAEARCQQGACVPDGVPPCVADADCPAAHQCLEGACVPGCASECCGPEDCAAGLECAEGACRTPCTSNCECAAGEACLNGYCTTL